jgi:predicted nucleic acid-binding Zn ribbon protein
MVLFFDTMTRYQVSGTMPEAKKGGTMPEDIVNIQGAAKILSERSGRSISQDYVRQLRRQRRLQATNEEEKGKQTKAYLFRREDVEKITIGPARIRGVRTPRKRKRISTGVPN